MNNRKTPPSPRLYKFMSYAPINVTPHLPQYGAEVGVSMGLHNAILPEGRAFDQLRICSDFVIYVQLSHSSMEMGQIPYIGEGQGGDIDGISRGIASPTLPHPGAFDILLMQIPYLPRTGGWGVTMIGALMRTMLEILFGIQPRSGKLLHLLGRLSRYTRPNCEQLEICLDLEHLLCRNQAKIENIYRSWRSIRLVAVQCFIVACLAGLNTAASVFFQN